MNKKKIIFWAIVVLVIVGIVLYVHFVNPLATLVNVVVFGVGAVAGWVAKIFYDKYLNKE